MDKLLTQEEQTKLLDENESLKKEIIKLNDQIRVMRDRWAEDYDNIVANYTDRI